MKITLPNGITIEADGAVEVDGLIIAPVTYEEVPAPELVGDDEPEEEVDEEDLEEEEPEPRIAGQLQKSCRYPTEVASLSDPMRNAYKILARYDNEQGVHSRTVARELGINPSTANTRCWNLWKKHGLAERVGSGRYRAVLIR